MHRANIAVTRSNRVPLPKRVFDRLNSRHRRLRKCGSAQRFAEEACRKTRDHPNVGRRYFKLRLSRGDRRGRLDICEISKRVAISTMHARNMSLKSCNRHGVLRITRHAIKALPDDRCPHVGRDAIHSCANNLIKITTDDTYENPIEGPIIPKVAPTKIQRCSARRGASLHPCV